MYIYIYIYCRLLVTPNGLNRKPSNQARNVPRVCVYVYVRIDREHVERTCRQTIGTVCVCFWKAAKSRPHVCNAAVRAGAPANTLAPLEEAGASPSSSPGRAKKRASQPAPNNNPEDRRASQNPAPAPGKAHKGAQGPSNSAVATVPNAHVPPITLYREQEVHAILKPRRTHHPLKGPGHLGAPGRNRGGPLMLCSKRDTNGVLHQEQPSPTNRRKR